MRRIKTIALLVIVLAGVNTSRALGPIDGELGLAWWNNDFTVDVSEGEFDAGALAGYADFWLGNRWGLRGALYRSDLEDVSLDSSEHFSIDVKRRLLSGTDNTFLAVGLGWEDIDIDNGSDADGPRFLLEGKLGILGAFSFYGYTAWLPELGDANDRSDLGATEFEAGVVFDPFPFLSVRAGYRQFKIDFTEDASGLNQSSKSSGFLLGAGVHW